MNNPQIRSYARAFAQKLLHDCGNGEPQSVNRAYQLALGRKPDATESKNASAFIKTQAESYNAQGKSDAQELALADFCQVLFGLNEFIYLE